MSTISTTKDQLYTIETLLGQVNESGNVSLVIG